MSQSLASYNEVRRRGRVLVERLEALEAEARRLRGDLADLLSVVEFAGWLEVIRPDGAPADSGEAGHGSHHQIARCSSTASDSSAQSDAAGNCAELPADYQQKLHITFTPCSFGNPMDAELPHG